VNETDKLQAYTSNEALVAKQRLADMAIEAKLVPKGMTTEQVILVLQKGHELGIPPTEALASMYVVNGRVALEGEAMLGLIYGSGKCAGIKFEPIRADEPDKQGWAVTMSRNDMALTHREVFTMKDAEKAGLLGKETYKSYPRVMLRWRAVAACARIVFPDVIGGLYLPEELGAPVEVDEDGTVYVPRVVEENDDDDEPVGIDEELLDEANVLGAALGFSAAKVRAEVDKAGPEHIDALLSEWREALAAKDEQEGEENVPEAAGTVERLDLGGDR